MDSKFRVNKAVFIDETSKVKRPQTNMRQGPKGIPRLHANLVRESNIKVNESRVDKDTSNTIVEEL